MTVERRDKGWRRILRESRKLAKGYAKVGVLRDKGSAKVEGNDSLTMVELAVIHEFGTGNAPERSFIRNTLEENVPEFKRLTRKLVKRVIKGSIDANDALDLMGKWGAGKVREKMASGKIKPPLAPATVARRRKGSSAPLVDTGALMGSVDSEVVL